MLRLVLTTLTFLFTPSTSTTPAVRPLPQLTVVSDSTTPYFERDRSVTLRCKFSTAIGQFAPPIEAARWYLTRGSNTKSIDSSNNYFNVLSNSTLVVTPGKRAHRVRGSYQCEVDVPGVGALRSKELYINQAYMKKFPRQTQTDKTQFIKVPYGNTAIINCKWPSSEPEAVRGVGFNGSYITESHGRYLLTERGLQISNVTADDADFYRCWAYNPVTKVEREDPVRQVLQIDSKNDRPRFVLPTTKRTTVAVLKGEDVTMDCAAHAFPQPEIFWERYTKTQNQQPRIGHLSSRAEYVFDNLRIRNVQLEDAGQYLCTVSAAHGVSDQSMFAIYELTVLDVLHVTISAQFLSDSVTRLTCDGPRDAELALLYNGVDVLEPGLSTGIRYDGHPEKMSSFSVNISAPFNFGVYQCIARRIFRGRLRTNTDAISIGPSRQHTTEVAMQEQSSHRPIIEQGPEDKTGNIGGSALMSCKVQVPVTNVGWLKDGIAIKNDERHTIYGSGSLDIRDLQTEDSGRYTCVARNSYGNTTASALLSVQVGDARWKLDFDMFDDRFFTNDKPKMFNMVNLAAPKVQSATADAVLVAWKMPDEYARHVKHYQLQYRKHEQGTATEWETRPQRLPHTSKEYVLDGLETGSRYRVRVVATFKNDEVITSAPSERIMLVPPVSESAPEYAPRIDSVNPISSVAMQVRWSQPLGVAQPDGFVITYRQVGKSAEKQVRVYGGSSTEHIVEHLLPETTYELRLQARNAQGMSVYSAPIIASTLSSARPNLRQYDSEAPQGEAVTTDGQAVLHGSFTYDVLATVAGVTVLGVILMAGIICVLCRKQAAVSRKRKATAKYTDPALSIYQDQARSDYPYAYKSMIPTPDQVGSTRYDGLHENGLVSVAPDEDRPTVQLAALLDMETQSRYSVATAPIVTQTPPTPMRQGSLLRSYRPQLDSSLEHIDTSSHNFSTFRPGQTEC